MIVNFTVCDFCRTNVKDETNGIILFAIDRELKIRDFKHGLKKDICICNDCKSQLSEILLDSYK